MSKFSLTKFVSLALCALTLGAYGGNYTWQSATDGSWNTPANWGTEAVPTTADDYALFPTLTTSFTVTDVAPRTLAEIQVTGGTRANLDLGGGKLTMDEGSTTRTYLATTSRIYLSDSDLTLRNGSADLGFVYVGDMKKDANPESLTFDGVDVRISGFYVRTTPYALFSQNEDFTLSLVNGARLITTNSAINPYLFYQGQTSTLIVSNATLATRGFDSNKTSAPRIVIGDGSDVYFGTYYSSSVAGSTLVCVDSTFTMASAAGLMPSASDTTLGFARSTLNLGAINGAYSLYPNASGVTIALTNCTTTLAGGVFFSTVGAGSTVRLEGGSVSMAGMINLPQPNVTVVLKDLTVTPAGGVSIASTGAFIVLEGSAELKVDGANKKFTSGTVGGAVLTDPSGLKFVLGSTPAASAPVKMNAANSSSKFYGNTAIVVDASSAGEAVEARTYPLVYSADAFSTGKADYEAFLTLLRQHATLPTGATLGLSEDKKTICVTLPASANVVYVGFEYDNGVGIVTNKILKGGKTTAPAAEFREGYVFSGWTRDAGATVLTSDEVAQLTFDADTTFVAQYKADSKTTVDIPTVAETAVYTGAVNKPAIAENEGYTIDWGEGDWTHVGVYTVTLTLTDITKYVWSDGSSDPKAFGYTITQTTNAWTEEPTVATTWTVGTVPTHSLGAAAFGTVAMTPSAAGLAEVPVNTKCTVVFTVAGTADYTGLEKRVEAVVRPAGIDPTGDPDAVSTTYTWKNDVTNGYWFNPASWTPSSTPCFGYPGNAYGIAKFVSTTEPVTVVGGPEDVTFNHFYTSAADVTLQGGSYRLLGYAKYYNNWNGCVSFNGSLTLDGVTMELNGGKASGHFIMGGNKGGMKLVVRNSTLTVDDGNNIIDQNGKESNVFAFTNSTVSCNQINLRTGGEVRLHDTVLKGGVSLAGGSLPGHLYVTGRTAITNIFQISNPGSTAYVAPEAAVCIQGNGGFSMGSGGTMAFNGTKTGCSAAGALTVANQTLLFTNGTVATTWAHIGFKADAASNSVYVIENSSVTGGNQLYMPFNAVTTAGDCAMEFRGTKPSFTSGKTSVYCGNSDTDVETRLPVFRFALPEESYASVPVTLNGLQKDTAYYANTPIELDLTACKDGGTYSLINIANGIKSGLLGACATEEDKAAFVAMQKQCVKAYVVRTNGTRRDVSSRIRDYTFDGKLISVKIGCAGGLSVIIR